VLSEEIFFPRFSSLGTNLMVMSQVVDGNFDLVKLIKVLGMISDLSITKESRSIISNRKTVLEITTIKAASMFL
jgi:hypothetical protein